MTNENDSNTPPADTQNQPLRQPPVMPPTPPQGEVGQNPNDRPTKEQETAKELAREFRWVEGAQLVVNGVLAIVGIIALCIYHGQLNVMQGQLGEIIKQYPELQKSADAAKSAARTAADTLTNQQDAFHVDHRPYVFNGLLRGVQGEPVQFLTPVANQFLQANVHFTNYGRSPAVQLRIGCRISHGKDALKAVTTLPFDIPTGAVVVPPEEEGVHTCASVDKPDLATIQADYGTDYYVVIFGNIEYRDMWNNSPPYMTEFCSVRFKTGVYGECKTHHKIT